jgi:hypothetical protein
MHWVPQNFSTHAWITGNGKTQCIARCDSLDAIFDTGLLIREPRPLSTPDYRDDSYRLSRESARAIMQLILARACADG